MLGRLLKYEIKAFGRIMLPLYGALLAISIVFGITIRLSMTKTASTLIERFAIISGFLFFAAIVAVMVIMTIMIIQRFYRNLLGTEGYLMFTLPATTLEHILSKALCALLWLVLGMITGSVSGFILITLTADLKEFLKQVQQLLNMLHADSSLVPNILLLAVMIIIGLMGSLSKVYASISIGHQWGSHRVMGAVLAYIGIGIFEVLVTSVLRQIGLNIVNNLDLSFRQMALTTIAISSVQILFYGFIAWRLLDTRLNLE